MLKNSIKSLCKNFTPFTVSIICLYALYLRLMFLHQHTLWVDELDQLSTMKGTFVDLIKLLPQHEFCSYLSGEHLLIYPFFKIFSYNKWGLTIPHIIATIIGFFILYFICKRYFKSAWAYFITFSIVCFNATLINHATEIRTYAVLPTLALATFYLFQRIADLNLKMNTAKKIAAIIFFILVIWFHVYGILMFVSCLLFTIFSKYQEKDFGIYFKNVAFFAAIILCLAMPLWLYSVFGPHIAYVQFNLDPFKYIPNLFLDILGFFKGIFCNLIGYKKLYFLFLSVIVPFIFSYEDRRKQLLYLLFIIITPIASILFFDLKNKYWFLQRQFIFVMPLFAFFLGWAWDSFFILVKRIVAKR